MLLSKSGSASKKDFVGNEPNEDFGTELVTMRNINNQVVSDERPQFSVPPIVCTPNDLEIIDFDDGASSNLMSMSKEKTGSSKSSVFFPTKSKVKEGLATALLVDD